MGTGTLRTTPWRAGMKGSQEVTKRLTVWTEGYFWRQPAWLGALSFQGKKSSCVIPSSSSHLFLALPSLCLFPGSLGTQWEDWNLSEGRESSQEEEYWVSGSGGGTMPVLLFSFGWLRPIWSVMFPWVQYRL